MIAAAMIFVATGPNITATTAVATRSSGAVCICPSVRTERNTKLHAIYKADTTPTPTPSDSGRSRLGLRTSPAVKRDVVPRVGCKQRAHHRGTHQSHHRPAPRSPPPEIVEIGCDGRWVAAKQEAQSGQSDERNHFRNRENVLNNSACANPARIHQGQHQNNRDREKLLRGQTKLPRTYNVISRRNRWHETRRYTWRTRRPPRQSCRSVSRRTCVHPNRKPHSRPKASRR